MFRLTGKLAVLSLAAAVLALLSAKAALAQEDPDPSFEVQYYDTTLGDNVVRISNPTINNMCADIYVFDANEQLQECCGCPLTAFGLRKISVATSLTTNPLTNGHPYSGVVEIIPSQPGASSEFSSYLPTCNAAQPTWGARLRSWMAHVNQTATYSQVSAEEFSVQPLWSDEQSQLAYYCDLIKKKGSGRGICSCGSGDNFTPIPPQS